MEKVVVGEDNVVFVEVDLTKPNPFQGRSVCENKPVTCPLQSLEDLLSWKSDDPEDLGQEFCVASVPYHHRIMHHDSRKTLVCHDMKGGYLNDKYGTLISFFCKNY